MMFRLFNSTASFLLNMDDNAPDISLTAVKKSNSLTRSSTKAIKRQVYS